MKKLAIVLLIVMPVIAGAQLIKTSLNLTVRDELGNTVEKATIALYENEADYKEEKNPAAVGVTDPKGVCKFKDVKAIAYFVIVRKDDKDNAGGGERIGQLDANKINKVTIVIQ
ncbi:MAG: carboxypeptidase regulatory-like domain-containing protein [Cyclobacteriaceae bacterium]|nr:carboxypeptidase regulatory-like domain-containing protein [Cyclobacteriaceae bacterium]